MKHTILVASLLLALPVWPAPARALGLPNYVQAVNAEGPIGYWRMGDLPAGPPTPMADSGPNGIDGSYVSSPEPILKPGGPYTGAEGYREFRPGGGYATIPHHAAFANLDHFTVMAWVRFRSAPLGPLFQKQDSDPGAPDLYLLGWSNLVRCRLQSGTNIPTDVSARNVLANNEWYHVACTFDGTRLELYVDGMLVDVATPSGTFDFSKNDVPILVGPSAGSLDGDLDELALFDKALTKSEIRAIMAADRPKAFRFRVALSSSRTADQRLADNSYLDGDVAEYSYYAHYDETDPELGAPASGWFTFESDWHHKDGSGAPAPSTLDVDTVHVDEWDPNGLAVYLSYKGPSNGQMIGGIHVTKSDVVKYYPDTDTAEIALAGSDVFNSTPKIFAFSIGADGWYYFSTSGSTNLLSGVKMDNDDVVKVDPSRLPLAPGDPQGDKWDFYFRGSWAGNSLGGDPDCGNHFSSGGENIDGLHVFDPEYFGLSTSGTARLGTEYYDPNNPDFLWAPALPSPTSLVSGSWKLLNGDGLIYRFRPAGACPKTVIPVFDEANFQRSRSQTTALWFSWNPAFNYRTLTAEFESGNGSTVPYCQTQRLIFKSLDSEDINDINTVYGARITLDTQEGIGSWTLIGGNPARFDNGAEGSTNNGIATYQFDPDPNTGDQGEATFELDFSGGFIDPATSPTSRTVTIAITDDIHTDFLNGFLSYPSLVYAPVVFQLSGNVLPNPAGSGDIQAVPTQTAGASFNVQVATIGQLDTDAECSIIESYDGVKSIDFDATVYVDPPTGAGKALMVTGTSGEVPVGTTTDVLFTHGQATLPVRYQDAGTVSLAMSDTTEYSPTTISGSTQITVKPAELVISSVEDGGGSANPGATGPGGSAFVSAGSDFTVEVEAVDTGGSPTPNFGNETAPESVALLETLVAPAGGHDPGLSYSSSFSKTGPGVFRSTGVQWHEVGVISLQARVADGSYLGTGDDLTGSAIGNVGRFYPAQLQVDPPTTAPRLQPACDGFTYVGQPFGLSSSRPAAFEVTARSATGQTTQNYSIGSWWKIGSFSPDPNTTFTDASAPFPLEVDPGGVITVNADPNALGPGQGTVTLDAPLRYQRNSATPQNPFDASASIDLTVTDADGAMGSATASGVFFDPAGAGGGKVAYGRVRISDVVGSELRALEAPMQIERYDGGTWKANDWDTACTDLTVTGVVSVDTTSTEAQTLLAHTDVPQITSQGVQFAAPGVDSITGKPVTGDLAVTVDLTSYPWLKWDWKRKGLAGGAPDQDPRALVSFGIYRGHDEIVYLRELY